MNNAQLQNVIVVSRRLHFIVHVLLAPNSITNLKKYIQPQSADAVAAVSQQWRQDNCVIRKLYLYIYKKNPSKL